MRVMNIFLIILCFSISGCISSLGALVGAGSAISDPTIANVEAETHKNHFAKQDANKAVIYVIWPKWGGNVGGSGSGVYLNLNDKRAGVLMNKTYTAYELNPGKYKVSVIGKEKHVKHLTVNIKKGKNIYLRVGIDSTGTGYNKSLYISLEDNENLAEKTIANSTYVTLPKTKKT